MYEPNSETLQMAAEAADRLIGFYPSIMASDPKIYAAGLVQLFSRYPEHLVAKAIDPVDGLPGSCDFLPTIAKVKAFIEPLWQDELRTAERRERFNRKALPKPERDPEADKRISEGFRSLAEHLEKCFSPSTI